MFKRIENNIDFAENEDKISNYWNDIDAFQKSLDIRKESKIFRFYDGPHFQQEVHIMETYLQA